MVLIFSFFFFLSFSPSPFPSSSRNFSSDGRNLCSCFYPHCIFIYRKHKWGGSGAFGLLGKVKNPQAALWPWQRKGIVLDNICKSPGEATHLHFFNDSSDCLFSIILHVTIPSISGFTLISCPSRLMLQSTLFAALVYRQAVPTALWFGIFFAM